MIILLLTFEVGLLLVALSGAFYGRAVPLDPTEPMSDPYGDTSVWIGLLGIVMLIQAVSIKNAVLFGGVLFPLGFLSCWAIRSPKHLRNAALRYLWVWT